MKLLSITLDGDYKGLSSDTFDFSGNMQANQLKLKKYA